MMPSSPCFQFTKLQQDIVSIQILICPGKQCFFLENVLCQAVVSRSAMKHRTDHNNCSRYSCHIIICIIQHKLSTMWWRSDHGTLLMAYWSWSASGSISTYLRASASSWLVTFWWWPAYPTSQINFTSGIVHNLLIAAYHCDSYNMWLCLQRSTMWAQIMLSYIFAKIFCLECSIPFP